MVEQRNHETEKQSQNLRIDIVRVLERAGKLNGDRADFEWNLNRKITDINKKITEIVEASELLQTETGHRVTKTSQRLVDLLSQFRKTGEEAERRMSETNQVLTELIAETDQHLVDIELRKADYGKRIVEMVEEAENREDEWDIDYYYDNIKIFKDSPVRHAVEIILDEEFDAELVGYYSFERSYNDVLRFNVRGESRNGPETLYLVVIRSKFCEYDIERAWKDVEFHRKHSSRDKNRPIFTIAAAIDIAEDVRNRIWSEGMYLVEIVDGVFRLADPPSGFRPNGYHGLGTEEL